MTVNCARIIYGNQVATNGVVHVIDRVIESVSNSIRDVLDVDDDLSSFRVSKINSTQSSKWVTKPKLCAMDMCVN